MKIVIFGAAGGVGKHLVQQAFAAGHEVTAFQRKADGVTDRGRLQIVEGDLLDLPSVQEAIQGQDVVLSSFGAHGRKDADIYPKGIANILLAMKEQGVRRLVAVTSAGVDDDPNLPFFFKRIIKPFFLKDIYAGMKQMESDVEQSGLDWTIIRPGTLTDGPLTGKYRILENDLPKGGSKISRADVADLMLKEATDTQHIHKKLVIVY